MFIATITNDWKIIKIEIIRVLRTDKISVVKSELAAV